MVLNICNVCVMVVFTIVSVAKKRDILCVGGWVMATLGYLGILLLELPK